MNESAANIEVTSLEGCRNRKVRGFVQRLEGKSLTILSNEEIVESSTVRVQTNDLLCLGEVLASIQHTVGTWTVSIQVRRSLAVL